MTYGCGLERMCVWHCNTHCNTLILPHSSAHCNILQLVLET